MKSLYRGVYWNKANRVWIAGDGFSYYGSFDNEEEAAAVSAVRRYKRRWGYYLNIIEQGKKNGEEWRVVPDTGYMAFVSNRGRVMSLMGNPRVLAPGYGSQGRYLLVSIVRWGKRRHQYVHRLVAEAFLDKEDSLNNVRHLDFDRSNNHVSNLKWCDQKESKGVAIKAGRMLVGRKNGRAAGKLTKDQAAHIKWQLTYAPRRGLSTALAIQYNVYPNTISNISVGKTWAWVCPERC